MHEHGSVNTMKDRRHDLYSLKKIKIMKNCLECEKIVGRGQNSVVTVVNAYNNKINKDSIITCATSTTSCARIIVFYQNLTPKENQNNLS
jgi:hypothetical protein